MDEPMQGFMIPETLKDCHSMLYSVLTYMDGYLSASVQNNKQFQFAIAEARKIALCLIETHNDDEYTADPDSIFQNRYETLKDAFSKISPSSSNSRPKQQCGYTLTRGDNKGHLCSKTANLGFEYCSSHCKLAGLLPNGQTTVTKQVCSAVLVQGKKKGHQCSNFAKKNSELCSRHHGKLQTSPNDDGIAIKEKCAYIMIRGDHEGEQCTRNATNGTEYCTCHAKSVNNKLARAQAPAKSNPRSKPVAGSRPRAQAVARPKKAKRSASPLPQNSIFRDALMLTGSFSQRYNSESHSFVTDQEQQTEDPEQQTEYPEDSELQTEYSELQREELNSKTREVEYQQRRLTGHQMMRQLEIDMFHVSGWTDDDFELLRSVGLFKWNKKDGMFDMEVSLRLTKNALEQYKSKGATNYFLSQHG